MPKHPLCSDSRRTISAPTHIRRLVSILAFAALSLSVQGCNKPKAMDVLWSNDLVDDNGFARNPVWSHMKQTGQVPNACSFCPCDNEDPQAWKAADNCTNQTLETNSSLECFGHWNWFPVEYEGVVTWGGHSNSWYDDDDYYFDVARSDRALQTDGGNGARLVHLEFNSEETVDYWDDTNTWWDDFHHNAVDHSDQTAHDRIDGKDVIIIGLFGLDKQHDVPSELHPVYAMFVHVQDDPIQDKWAFFVRNWGDEGYCGDNQENLDRRTIKVRIRHPGATSVTLQDNAYVYGDDEDERNQQSWSYQVVNDGILLTFSLRDPSKQVGFVGDLTINWGGASVTQQTAGSSSQRATAQAGQSQRLSETDEGDTALKAKIDKLDPTAQKLLYRQVKNLMPHHPKPQVKRATKDTSPPPELAKSQDRFPNYGTIVKSVKDPASRARKEKIREVVLSFLKAHGIE